MRLTSEQRDRAAGVLLGQAIGDALGVPYEFAPRVAPGEARMIGGGLGPYAPGEWSDDTQMAICIARVSATGADLTTASALDEVAQGFIDWRTHGASDIGNLTAAVLAAGPDGTTSLSLRLTNAARRHAASGSAGNGALMRTAVVGLTRLDDREATARSAASVAALTHADRRCVASCVLWSEAVRVAVVDGLLDVRAGLDLLKPMERTRWTIHLDDAESHPSRTFEDNGYTVTALQAAWSAIWSTRHGSGTEHVTAALQRAVSIGSDTDTVAAIAGGLLGACYGASALPKELVAQVHGWPGLHAPGLEALARDTAVRGLGAKPDADPSHVHHAGPE